VAAFLVMLLSIASRPWRSRALGRIATSKTVRHWKLTRCIFQTDIWSSGVVIVGLALVWAGRSYNVGWLRKADPSPRSRGGRWCVSVSWRFLARRTVDALLDAAPAGVRNQILDRSGPSMACWKLERYGSGSWQPLFRERFGGSGTQFYFSALEQVSDA